MEFNWKELSEGKLFGHPIHVMLIHFPSALFPFSLILDGIGLYSGVKTFFGGAVICMIGGLAFGLVAAGFGFNDYISISRTGTAAKIAGRHGIMQALVLSVFGILLGIRLAHSIFYNPGILLLSIEAVTVILLLYGNYLGGELILRFGVGSRQIDGNEKEPQSDQRPSNNSLR